MAQFFHDDAGVKAKLVSAVWNVEGYRGQLYGKIECRFKEQLTEAERRSSENGFPASAAMDMASTLNSSPSIPRTATCTSPSGTAAMIISSVQRKSWMHA